MMAMISVSVRLRREISVTISVSPLCMRRSSGPSLRSLFWVLPLTVSVTQRSMVRLREAANRRISSFWFSMCCFSVLTRRYAITDMVIVG